MTRYTVVWHQLALDELADLWVQAPDRGAITQATSAIDHELADDPATKGRRVSERSRELTVPPLHVLFRVQTDDRKVEVFSITSV
jgi:hypothetical protein